VELGVEKKIEKLITLSKREISYKINEI